MRPMNKDMERHKLFTRRAAILGAAKLGVFSVLGSRLAYLQIVEQEKFKTLSDKNRIGLKILTSARGEIIDRFGVPIALNTPNFRAFLTPEQSPNIKETLDKLSSMIPLNDKDKLEILAHIKKQRRFTPVLVKENLSWEQVAQVEVHLPNLPGIYINEGTMRHYPLTSAAGHIAGYVGLVNPSELTDDPVMRLPGFRIGKTGVEKQHDAVLRGKSGTSQIEVNATGREIRQLNQKDSQHGKRVQITLDAELQLFCQNLLSQQKSAAAVVMDAHTGDIYALSSTPGFDPNMFTRGITPEQWEELLSNPGKPLTNKAIAGQYPPGSTFKMITALAALESGVVGGGHSVSCSGYIELGRDRFHCWKRGGHGKIGFTSSLEQSCDIFYYDIARKTGIDNIAKMARRFGFGQRLGLDLPGEAPGLVPDKEWKRGYFGSKWQIGETVVAGIGQGYILTTPLQLATMTARLVNGGYAVEPRLTRHIEDNELITPKFKKMNINPYHLNIVKNGMKAVMTGPKGTAAASQIREKGFAMAGKTGTAQVKRITRKQRAEGIKNKDLPWKHRHHALFVAYAPLKKPRYVCAVIVEHGVSGSGTAAPVARDIMHEVQKRDPAKSRIKDIT